MAAWRHVIGDRVLCVQTTQTKKPPTWLAGLAAFFRTGDTAGPLPACGKVRLGRDDEAAWHPDLELIKGQCIRTFSVLQSLAEWTFDGVAAPH
ncbi:hypothetical protein [Cupriavidus sp. CuC1]|uniref:hypothetical protein n=1 Tax=Cupriavidus sp. CuC1 TaxID=3373131 RepID=UPI0037D1B381